MKTKALALSIILKAYISYPMCFIFTYRLYNVPQNTELKLLRQIKKGQVFKMNFSTVTFWFNG